MRIVSGFGKGTYAGCGTMCGTGIGDTLKGDYFGSGAECGAGYGIGNARGEGSENRSGFGISLGHSFSPIIHRDIFSVVLEELDV
jgi:hypothetical protein